MPNTVVKMPQLGESVAEGTIGRWLKQPGDRVELDEPLVEIQTDKVNAEVPSPVAGILQQILLPEGTTAAVKTDMAIIGDEQPAAGRQPTAPEPPVVSEPAAMSDSPAAQGPEGTTTQRTPAESAAAAPPQFSFTYDSAASGGVVGHREDEEPGPPSEANGAKRFFTPVVLRMAEEHAIDLSTIQGTGAHGRVTRKDVERAIAEPRGTAAAPAHAAPPRRPSPTTANARPETGSPSPACWPESGSRRRVRRSAAVADAARHCRAHGPRSCRDPRRLVADRDRHDQPGALPRHTAS